MSYVEEVIYLEDEAELLRLYKKNYSVRMAVIFSDDPIKNKSYKIRMNPTTHFLPSSEDRFTMEGKCRSNSSTLGYDCSTNLYYHSSFLILQYFVDAAIIKISTKVTYNINLFLQSFPKF